MGEKFWIHLLAESLEHLAWHLLEDRNKKALQAFQESVKLRRHAAGGRINNEQRLILANVLDLCQRSC